MSFGKCVTVGCVGFALGMRCAKMCVPIKRMRRAMMRKMGL